MIIHPLKVYKAKTMTSCLAYLFDYLGTTAWLPAAVALGLPSKLHHELSQREILLTGKDVLKDLARKVSDADDYPGDPPIDTIGWNPPFYSFANGLVTAPQRGRHPPTMYEEHDELFGQAGTSAGWQHSVEHLGHQPLLLCLILLPLLATLRPLLLPASDLLFELVLPQSSQAEFVRALVGSVTGGNRRNAHLHGDEFFKTMWPNDWGDRYNDQLMILFDVELFTAGKPLGARTNDARQLLSREVRSAGACTSRPRVLLLVDRTPFAQQVDEHSAIGQLAAERFITLGVAPERQYGLFDTIPEPYRSHAELARKIQRDLPSQHGQPLQKFVQRLVRHRAQDEAGLLQEVRRLSGEFRRRSKVDESNGFAVQAVDAFGLLYATGKLAKQWNVIPSAWPLGPTLLDCMRRFHSAPARRISFDDELRRLIKNPDAVHAGYGQPEPDKEAISAADYVVWHRKHYVEVLIRPEAKDRCLIAFDQRKTDAEVVARWKRDMPHDGSRRPTLFGNDRPLCFRLPRDEVGG